MNSDPNFKAKLQAALQSNMSSGEIARKFNIARNNVSKYRKALSTNDGGLRDARAIQR